jgi:type II secretory pathway component GspD/PulD (secretin)
MSRPLVAIVVLLGLLLSGPGLADGEDLSLTFEEESFSAHVEESPLKAVTEKIESETGIWFKAGESVLQKRVSVVFDGLPFEDGLERILSKMNYSLVFGDDDEIVGVFLFRSLDPGQKQVIRRAQSRARTRRVVPRTLPRRRTIPTRQPQPFRN